MPIRLGTLRACVLAVGSAGIASLAAPVGDARAGTLLLSVDPELRGPVHAAATGVRGGLPALSVDSPAALLDALRLIRPRAAIIDERQSGENAPALVAALREADDRLPIVFVATADSPELERAVRRAGAIAFLTRPLSDRRLQDLVRALLARGEAS